ncbi:hypothetical protein COCMIDRAFT_32983 [Bipolaris oryzae ATCC 44560]|uniref:Uncharacterized protein n=1 Tax=Bipolaris oryzae ATCC 44560 TaxID=930090 RepID=W6ZPZ4_COCMI|nr:uncharacterized protein COCMIDRAFT_32983 [Bipolaris oryzae ATCC 44560]EUC49554.1 hypothetical protein COCMIDRAFT_32983 [Bipolaris oryzae ATCC 44560]
MLQIPASKEWRYRMRVAVPRCVYLALLCIPTCRHCNERKKHNACKLQSVLIQQVLQCHVYKLASSTQRFGCVCENVYRCVRACVRVLVCTNASDLTWTLSKAKCCDAQGSCN